ncbi:MAG: IclR family transcriptional regulator [Actinomycetota bacterium]
MSSDEFIQSLARGLTVIRSFDVDRPSQTLSDVARETGLTRATARRVLHTLVELGYAATDGKQFWLTPSVLDIGYAYLSSLNVQQIAQPFLEQLSEEVQESVSVSVLDGADIVYVARVPTKRIMTIALGLGTRLPAHCTSMGRVLLAELSPNELADRLGPGPLEARTDRTVTDPDELRARLDEVRRQGWALIDQELELGVRSMSAPLRDASGSAIAAMNVSSHAGRTTLDELHDRFLSCLLDTAGRVNEALAKR